jgi:hypothetical protein
MTELRWNKADFLECFGVLPETEEDEGYYGYTVTRAGLVLLVTVRPYESVIDIRLRREACSDDFFAFSLLVGGAVEYKREKWGDYLLLPASRVVADHYYYIREEGAVAISQEVLLDVEIAVDPDIRLTIV